MFTCVSLTSTATQQIRGEESTLCIQSTESTEKEVTMFKC